jgi:putative NADH-flavin reductase
MKSILLFGASGNVGKHVAMEASKQGYNVTAVVRNAQKAKDLAEISHSVIVADVMKPLELEGICKNFDVVISALGKRVSPNDNSKATFYDVDFLANARILKDAIVSGVKKFVYVSALTFGTL